MTYADQAAFDESRYKEALIAHAHGRAILEDHDRLVAALAEARRVALAARGGVDFERPCERCGAGEAAGAAGLCSACDALADAREARS